ncbi:FAD-binding oxidoreductase [Allohahella sp. A8]|uniref:FAD-binding oxidoreductase n=1 Tax=Allohahella sp. A8 TaxID=3141461 RepID=UPI003A7F78F9
MRRWNGWGDTATAMDLPEQGLAFLGERVGAGYPLPDAKLEAVKALVPPSRLQGIAEATGVDVMHDAESRIRHARGQSLADWLAMRSGRFGAFPDAVAFPRSSADVRKLLVHCARHDIVVIPYGGGTSVAGHVNPVEGTSKPVLTVSLSRMNSLQDLDEESQIATFGAGVAGPHLEAQLRAKGFTLGHFPQSFELSTLGGWVVTRSSGQQSLRYGRIEQLFAGGRVELMRGDGEALDIPAFPASAAGPDLREWCLGSEGRMGILTEVKVRVTRLAEKETFLAFFLPNWTKARDAARALVQSRTQLSMLRVSNAVETETQLALAGHPGQIAWLERYLGWRGAAEGKCMMTLGVTGSRAQVSAVKQQLKHVLSDFGAVSTGELLGRKWAEKRFMMPYLREALWQQGYVVDTLETATNWRNVDRLLNAIEDNLRTTGPKTHVFTHLSHVYSQGCSIYTTYVFPCQASYDETLKTWAKLKHSTSRIIVEHGGTISHQHGVGKDHAPYLPAEKGDVAMEAIGAVMKHFDPAGLLNPGTLLADAPGVPLPEQLAGD